MTNGMGCITEATSGFPNANGHVPFECANLAEVLGERGWNTYIVGKWHLCARTKCTWFKRQRPLGRGFERAPRLPRRRDEAHPDLVYDNHPVPAPRSPEEGYHLTVDLTDTIEFVQDAKVIAPDTCSSSIFCPGASPRAAPCLEGMGRQVQGTFDMGYAALPELVRSGRSSSGSSPREPSCRRSTRMPTRRATTASPGRTSTALTRTRSRTTSSGCSPGMAEVYAGFSHATSGHLGDRAAARQHDHRARLRQRRLGRGRAERLRQREQVLQPTRWRTISRSSTSSGSTRTYNHYPTGWAWAFNTASKLWKRYANYEGGTADLLIVVAGGEGEIRRRAPCRGHRADPVRVPADVVNGYTQKPLEGVSFKSSLADRTLRRRRRSST